MKIWYSLALGSSESADTDIEDRSRGPKRMAWSIVALRARRERVWRAKLHTMYFNRWRVDDISRRYPVEGRLPCPSIAYIGRISGRR